MKWIYCELNSKIKSIKGLRFSLIYTITKYILLLLYQTSSIAMKMRSALFWDFNQRRMLIPCRSFGTASRFHLQESNSLLGLHDL